MHFIFIMAFKLFDMGSPSDSPGQNVKTTLNASSQVMNRVSECADLETIWNMSWNMRTR